MLTIIHLLVVSFIPSYTNNNWISNHFDTICDILLILDMITMSLQLYLYLTIVYS